MLKIFSKKKRKKNKIEFLTHEYDREFQSSLHGICIPVLIKENTVIFCSLEIPRKIGHMKINLTNGFVHDPCWHPGKTWHSLQVGPAHPNRHLHSFGTSQ